ncbi:hypothetical protein D7W81_07015 [Corallococcus aberystwythensis]|uniref:Kazal-like domain-containing protein n=1 Tax=Corallococcus aberystwythensis TaxID=2316722 RepID=A0A3A8QY43_9BACT|nr:hypothetical protein D7W81_07015 [Corallococcus aberystwythensis]
MRRALLTTLALAGPSAMAGIIIVPPPPPPPPLCLQPSLSQCSSVTYRNSYCGAQYDAYCQTQVETAWTARHNAAPKRTAVLPQSLGGGTGTVAYQAPQVLNTAFEGGNTTVAGQVLRGQVLARKGYQNLTAAEQAYKAVRDAWETNGEGIRSCQEYVHEKYYDFSRFEQGAGAYGDDFRALYEASKGTGGIASRTLYGKDGQALAPLWTSTSRAPKNAYYRFAPGAYPPFTTKYLFTSTAATKANNVLQRTAVTISDAWHQAMSTALIKVPDAVLNDSQRRQEAFEDLLARRDAVYAAWQRQSAKGLTTASINSQTALQLRTLDQSIESALVAAETEGCFETKVPRTSCDWSPRRYKVMVDKAMMARREADLSRCLLLTGNDFGEESFVRNAERLQLASLPDHDYTLNATLLTSYLQAYLQGLKDGGGLLDASTRTKRKGNTQSDSAHVGDDKFGGGYTFVGGWAVDSFGEGLWCETDARIFAALDVNVNVFSTNRTEVAHLEGEASTQGNDIRLKLNARVLGVELYNHDMAYPMHVTLVQETQFPRTDAARASGTFMVWFIPVTVTGGISATAGVRTELAAALTRDCAMDTVDLDLDGLVAPFGNVSGFVSVGAGVPDLQVGVMGSLTLINHALPLQAELGVHLTSSAHPTDPNRLFLHVEARLDQQLRLLDGTLSLFGQVGPFKGEFPLVAWPGLGTTNTLFTEAVDLPLYQL